MSVEIRAEEDGDRAKIYELNVGAFPTDAEAKLVDALRDAARPFLVVGCR